MKYFRVLNSRVVSTTGCPLRLTSSAEKFTITSPNSATLLVSAVFRRSIAWPHCTSNLVGSEATRRDLLSTISRAASFLMVDLAMRRTAIGKRDRLQTSFEFAD